MRLGSDDSSLGLCNLSIDTQSLQQRGRLSKPDLQRGGDGIKAQFIGQFCHGFIKKGADDTAMDDAIIALVDRSCDKGCL